MNSFRAAFKGKTVQLQSLCETITDCHHSTPAYTKVGKLVIRNFNIKNGRMLLDNISFTDDTHFKQRISRAKPEPGDLIITREAPMGEACIIPEGIECCLGQRMVLIKPDNNKVDRQFLLYSLLSEYAQIQIGKSNGTGSIVSNLRIPLLKELSIPDINIDSQEHIGKVLSAIDKKIELNNKINAELEAMAKLIYDYWFVQFDFPSDTPENKGKPYKSSGGKMVYNEELKREIPEGWVSGNVLEVASLLGGGTPSKKNSEFWGGSIPFFTPTDSNSNIFSLTTEEYITQSGLVGSSTKLFEKHTVFITARGSVGRLALNAVPMAMNQSCYAFRSKPDISYAYLFFLIKELIHHLEVKATGSVFNSIVSNDIVWTKLALPGDSKVIEDYAKTAEPIFERIELAAKENQKLAELRDWLLPMLMNGQVTVKDTKEK